MSIRKGGTYTLIIIMIFFPLLGCNQKADELAGTEWELISINGNDLIEGTAITLVFSETYLGGQMGCNGYGGGPDSGKYISKGDGTFQIGDPFAVTVQLCTNPEGIMEQESEYIDALMAATHYQILDEGLEIKDEAGDFILVYQRK